MEIISKNEKVLVNISKEKKGITKEELYFYTTLRFEKVKSLEEKIEALKVIAGEDEDLIFYENLFLVKARYKRRLLDFEFNDLLEEAQEFLIKKKTSEKLVNEIIEYLKGVSVNKKNSILKYYYDMNDITKYEFLKKIKKIDIPILKFKDIDEIYKIEEVNVFKSR